MFYLQEIGRNIDKAIIPPAATKELAKERLQKAQAGEIECFDWWFCYKKL